MLINLLEIKIKLIWYKELLIFFDDIILSAFKAGCNASIQIKQKMPNVLPLDIIK